MEFTACSKSAKTMPIHAKCVSRLLRDEIGTVPAYKADPRTLRRNPVRSLSRLERYKKPAPWLGQRSFDSVPFSHRHAAPQWTQKRLRDDSQWVGGFRIRDRRKRDVVRREDYQLMAKNEGLSPLGKVAKSLLTSVLAIKGKEHPTQ